MKDNIEYCKGNLLDVKSGVIIHGCNEQRTMGSGVALAIKQKYPEAYQAYVSQHDHTPGGLKIGEIAWWSSPKGELWIANAITQEYYGRDNKRYVNYAAVCKCFKEAIGYAYTMNGSLNFPKIGAGLGGGDWGIIQQLINDCDPENQVKKICWEL